MTSASPVIVASVMPAICHGNRRRCTSENDVRMLASPSRRRSIIRIVPANMLMLTTWKTVIQGAT